MASYKVSYKILRQQGEDMKAVAKLIDGYSERVTQVSGKLGEGELLAEVRTNLGKLKEQLTESRTVLQIAGEFLTKTVESYTGVELRQVKKADGTKAHQRDFYKNPVVVASVGGAVGGAGVAAAAMPSSAPASTTTTYVDNSVNVNYVAAESAPAVEAAPAVVSTAAPAADFAPAPAAVAAAPVADVAPVAAATGGSAVGGVAGVAAGASVLGGALGAGAVIGVKHLMDQDKEAKNAAAAKAKAAGDEYDPEAELAKALQRVRDLEENDA